jgi:hypothetical protein
MQSNPRHTHHEYYSVRGQLLLATHAHHWWHQGLAATTCTAAAEHNMMCTERKQPNRSQHGWSHLIGVMFTGVCWVTFTLIL